MCFLRPDTKTLTKDGMVDISSIEGEDRLLGGDNPVEIRTGFGEWSSPTKISQNDPRYLYEFSVTYTIVFRNSLGNNYNFMVTDNHKWVTLSDNIQVRSDAIEVGSKVKEVTMEGKETAAEVISIDITYEKKNQRYGFVLETYSFIVDGGIVSGDCGNTYRKKVKNQALNVI